MHSWSDGSGDTRARLSAKVSKYPLQNIQMNLSSLMSLRIGSGFYDFNPNIYKN